VDLAAYEKELRTFLAECEAEQLALQTIADLRGQMAASVA